MALEGVLASLGSPRFRAPAVCAKHRLRLETRPLQPGWISWKGIREDELVLTGTPNNQDCAQCLSSFLDSSATIKLHYPQRQLTVQTSSAVARCG